MIKFGIFSQRVKDIPKDENDIDSYGSPSIFIISSTVVKIGLSNDSKKRLGCLYISIKTRVNAK